MHCATLVYPCDNKRLLGGLESILGLFIGSSDNASSTAQRHQLPPQTTSTAPQATAGHWAHTGAALGTAGQLPPAKWVDIYSTCPSIEKSINWSKAQTVLKCSTKIISYFDKYQIIYYLSIVYFAILYYAIIYRNNNIGLINVVFSHAYAHEDPPRGQKF
jgi:hypothetical protein